MTKRALFILAIFVGYSQIFAQTGPGGVGNSTGINSQPVNVLWLKPDQGITTTGSLVDLWTDFSGNLNNASGTGATRPTLVSSDGNFNGRPTLSFSGTPGATNYNLVVSDAANLDNSSAMSMIVVYRPSNAGSVTGILSKRTGAGANQSYVIYHNGTSLISRIGSTDIASGTIANSTNYIQSTIMNGTAVAPFLNGTAQTTGTGPASIADNASNLFIGTFDDSGGENRNFEGTIAEVILYRTNLNAAQRQLIENYLSSKYNIAISNDVYAGDTGPNGEYDLEGFGIGRTASVSHTTAFSSGLGLIESNSSFDQDNEYVFAGHKTTSNSITTSNLGTGVIERWNRTWYIDKTSVNGVDATLAFDFGDGISGQNPSNKDNYVLLRLNTGTGNYEIVSLVSADKTIAGDQMRFRVTDTNLIDGVYTIGTIDNVNSPLIGTASRTWYSYQSGNWSSSLSWTLDGSLFPLYVNPSNEIPGPSDNIVINTGRTITMDSDGLTGTTLEVYGTLDIVSTVSHSFSTIKGNGIIRYRGSAGGVDNFMAGNATLFADPLVGGIVEIYGTGITLNQARTFNNVRLVLNTSGSIASLEGNLNVQGDLTLTTGIFRFGNASATTSRTVDVAGELRISSGAQITTGAGNARHELNLSGDFINQGSAFFTNRTSANYTTEATDGITDVNFVSDIQDQVVTLNGVTRFYRIEVNKGTDDTYKVTFTASSTANFLLFGYSNTDHASTAQLATNPNSVGLLFGTLEIGANIQIPVLSNTGNYNISAGAQLFVNGGTVNKDLGNSLVPYGVLRVGAGTLTANVSSGITTRDNGTILVDGGTLTTRQIRTSVIAASNIGGYLQNGGTVTVDGTGGINNDYAVFSMTYAGNAFSMSGGTLTVKGAITGTGGTRGAVFINSDPANQSITGGTVIFEINNNTIYRVTSKSPFWNVIIRKTAGTATTVQLAGTTSGNPGIESVVTAQPLVMLNDLTVENGVTFDANNTDVTIGGSLDIQNGATYTTGTNTTIINGSGVSSLTFGNTTTTQSFNNLTISKSSATDESRIANGAAVAIQVNGTLRVSQGIFDYNTFQVSAKAGVYVASTIGKSTSTGRLIFNGTSAQTIQSVNGTIHNLELNNTSGISLTTGNLNIARTLTMTAGVFDINQYKLSMSGGSSALSGTGYGTTKMIMMSGNASDEGFEWYYNTNESQVFPIGTDANSVVRYTPATVTIQGFADDGYISINLADQILQTTNLSGGSDILSYYWRSGNRNFTTAPLVSYQFSYDGSDVGGTETNYLPGKVLDGTPFTRSTEDVSDINTTTNLITFNGVTTGATFPGAGFTLERANYTAGASTNFTGTPTVYYSRTTGGATGFPGLDWHDPNSWSTVSHTGAAAASFPQSGDVAIIGSGNTGANNHHAVNVTNGNAVAAELIFATVPGGTFGPRLTCQENRSINFTRVSGPGTIMIRVTTTQIPTVVGDFGDFAEQTASNYIYFSESASATPISLPTNPNVFPNLRFEGGNTGGFDRRMTIPTDVTVNRNVNIDQQSNWILGGNVTVAFDVIFNDGTPGSIEFPSTGSALTFTIGQDLRLRTGAGSNQFIVGNSTPSSLVHRLVVGRNITIDNGSLDLNNGAAPNNNAVLEVNGTVSGAFTNTTGATTDLFRLVVNKGTSIATTFTVSDNISLGQASNLSTKPVELISGLLITDDPAIAWSLSSGTANFSIPSKAGLEVRQGTLTISGSDVGLNLDGRLTISGGSLLLDDAVNNGNNYIEYSTSGSAVISVTSGTLSVGSQLRRGLTNTAGILSYTQSGGTVIIGRRAAPTTSRGVFEVTNTGSVFNHTGGSLTISRGINSTTVPSILLRPTTYNLTGSTLTIGDANTPVGANSQNIGIQSTILMNNIVIAGSNNPIVKQYISPLTITGDFTIGSGTTFNSQGLNLSLTGNLIYNGNYISGSNSFTFGSNLSRTITGTGGTLTLFNLNKSGSGLLTTSIPILINKDISLTSGTINDGGNSITLKGNATINGTMVSSGGNGLVFSGTIQQQLRRSSIGTGFLGTITISNSNGVIIPDGQGYDFQISSSLRLEQGVFDIGGSLLTFTNTATIVPVNAFNLTNMIQTNSSFNDKGVKKIFNSGETGTFVFPVGQLLYTPATLTLSGTGAGSGTPAITVRPANERHPSIVEDTESPGPQITDVANVLQYHWIVTGNNITSGFQGLLDLTYNQSLISVSSPYTEADYLAARVLATNNPTNVINKFTTADVNETTNVITFSFANVNDTGISGDYFAGIDPAIPTNVPTYTTIRNGNVDEGSVGGVYDQLVPGGGAPNGGILIVAGGTELTFNVNNVSLYKTILLDGATLTVNGTIGHRLGQLTGPGTLNLVSNTTSAVIPAAIYDEFFTCSGGTLAYSGTGSYNILGGITALRSLSLQGSGQRVMANNDITLCDDLTTNGPTFLNSSNRAITIGRDFITQSGSFSTGNGTFQVTRDLVQTGGTVDGQTGGTKTVTGNTSLSGGTLSIGSGGIWNLRGNINYSGGTFDGGSGTSRIILNGTTAQTINGTLTGASDFNNLEISNTSGVFANNAIEINGVLTLTGGVITTTTSVQLGSGASVSPTIGKSNSYVSGKITKVLSSGSTFNFPVGRGSKWRPASLNATSAGPLTWQVEYFDGRATNYPGITNLTAASPTILTISTGEYWVISDGNAGPSGTTARIGLSWGTESNVSANTAQREAMQVMVWNTTTSLWDNVGGTSFSSGHTQSSGRFVASSTTSFSTKVATLGSSEVANPLPVELYRFAGEQQGNAIHLQWITETERLNDYFEIERSENGIAFKSIGKIKGAGWSDDQETYDFIDATPFDGRNYYRLRQVDLDGTVNYPSKIMVVEFNRVEMGVTVQVYPNPVTNGTLTIEVNGTDGQTVAALYDLSGRRIRSKVITGKDELDVTNVIPGMYILQIEVAGSKFSRKLIIK